MNATRRIKFAMSLELSKRIYPESENVNQTGQAHTWTSHDGPWGEVTNEAGENVARGINIDSVKNWAL